MEFSNSFTVAAPFDQVWSALNRVEEVAPCMPGAQITEMLDEHRFKGQVKIKLGAMQLSYRGEMAMEPDEATRTIVLQGKGTAQGQGSASARVTVTVEPVSDGTRVNIDSHVDVSGRVASFGRGIMQDVANRLVKEFSACLQEKLESGDGSGPEASETAVDEQPAEPEGQSNKSGDPGGTAPAPSAMSGPPAVPPAPTVPPPPARTPTGGSAPPAAAELKVVDLVVAVLRSRTAEGLRALANLIEPR